MSRPRDPAAEFSVSRVVVSVEHMQPLLRHDNGTPSISPCEDCGHAFKVENDSTLKVVRGTTRGPVSSPTHLALLECR